MPENTRSIGDLLSAIVADVQKIVRAEVRLARAEIREELARAKTGVMFLAVAGVAGLVALGLFLQAIVFAIATVWPLWAAALAVAAGAGLIGGLLWMAGMKRFRDLGTPVPKTVETLKENIQWAKTRT